MLFFILVSLVAVLALWVRSQFSYWKRRNVPYVEPSFPFGNLNQLGKRHLGLQIQNVYLQLKDCGKKFGGMFMSVKPAAVVVDLDFAKDVFVKDFQFFHDRGLYYNDDVEPINSHLVTLEGTRWRNLRAKLTPTFTSGKLKVMFTTMTAVADEFVKCLSAEAQKGEAIGMNEILARFTTDIIGSCAFGLDCNSLQDPQAKFRVMGRKAFERSIPSFSRRIFGLTFPKLAKLLRVRLIDLDVADFFTNVVKDTIGYREKNGVHRNDFMDLLIKMKNDKSANQKEGLTLDEISAQSFIFFLAGFETSSTAMTFCLLELAQNQQLQEKARKSVNEVLAQHGSMTYEAIHEMKYIEYCINESLRKYPPVLHITREITKDYHVSDMNVTLEKGNKIIIPIYAIHHDPQYYPDPEQYNPDRFNPEMTAKRHPMAFIPFGEGPRICIGLRFGMLQACIGLAYLLRNFRFTLSSKTVTPVAISPTSTVANLKGGLWLHVEKLQN